MTQKEFNKISDLREYLLRHPDQDMVTNSCLHFLGDDVQRQYKRNDHFNKYFKLVTNYMDFAYFCKEQINEYVPNSHIVTTFREVLEHMELEHIYWSEYHTHSESSNHQIIEKLIHDDYFMDIELYQKEIARVYDKLRDKHDPIRNNMKLINIHLRHIVMPHRSNQDLKAHKYVCSQVIAPEDIAETNARVRKAMKKKNAWKKF